MNTLQALSDRIAACLADADALVTLAKNEDRELTADEQVKFDGLVKESEELTAKAEKLQADEEKLAAAREKVAALNRPVRHSAPMRSVNVPPASSHFVEAKTIEFPRRRGSLKNVAKIGRLSAQEQEDFAYNFGIWVMAARGHEKALRYCAENGLALQAAAQTEGTNTTGGLAKAA